MTLIMVHHHAMLQEEQWGFDATCRCQPLSVSPTTTATAHLGFRSQELPSGKISQPIVTHYFSAIPNSHEPKDARQR